MTEKCTLYSIGRWQLDNQEKKDWMLTL